MLLQDLPHSVLVLIFELYAFEVHPASENRSAGTATCYSSLTDSRIQSVTPLLTLNRRLGAACADVQSQFAAPGTVAQFVQWASSLADDRRASRVRWLIVDVGASGDGADERIAAALLFALPQLRNLHTLELVSVVRQADLVKQAITRWTSVRTLAVRSRQERTVEGCVALRQLYSAAHSSLRSLTIEGMRVEDVGFDDMPNQWPTLLALDISSCSAWLPTAARITSRCPRLRLLVLDSDIDDDYDDDDDEEITSAQLWAVVAPVAATLRGFYFACSGGLDDDGVLEDGSGVYDSIIARASGLRLFYVPSFEVGLSMAMLRKLPGTLTHVGIKHPGIADVSLIMRLVTQSALRHLALSPLSGLECGIIEVCGPQRLTLTPPGRLPAIWRSATLDKLLDRRDSERGHGVRRDPM